MVYEFPELQGVMGRYYSDAAGFPNEVSTAVEEHYAPLGPSDDVPTAPVSVAVSLAEKIDKLTGFWAIDEKPTGSKDPFALRRAALGVIRLILENSVELPFLQVSAFAQSGFGVVRPEADDPDDFTNMDIELNLLSFIHDRLKVYLRDHGLRHDVIDACIAMEGNDDLARLTARAKALQEVLGTEDGENLVQGFKRANNILTQAEEKDGVEYSFGADRKFADAPEEVALFDALDAAEPAIEAAMQAQDFGAAMHAMAGMRPAVDAFFEAVQVNAENEVVRRNRLNLLSRIRTACLQVADLTKIEG